MRALNHFKYKFYIKTGSQEFLVAVKGIDAANIDDANKKLYKLDVPFHTFSTVQKID
jgi:hypothetical protein